MDEAEWLACADPGEMLAALTPGSSGLPADYRRLSDRKLRLWACACCRQAWDRLADPRSRKAVEVAERLADGEAGANEWANAHDAALDVGAPGSLPMAVAYLGDRRPSPGDILGQHGHPRPWPVGAPAAQAALLRCVVGSPFRPPPPVRAFGGLMRVGWLTPAVAGMAARVYAENDFSPPALGVLADALEEAGCRDADVLRHLRGWARCGVQWRQRGNFAVPTPHPPKCDCGGTGWVPAGPPCPACGGRGWHPGDVGCGACGATTPGTVGTGRLPAAHARGCWVLDLVLGRE